MNQSGKHGSEPARLDNKRERERRRGAAGRAAVLRRAPSDSDCSGETASLSADSGDRAPRPAPLAPPRAGKTRSRRRGSEWEVLEGLKDGQRFEKRPDVFNGYLHKKRKWPLKGWHKRFFVVDGGILVYARSPTDVARGRLHGSVDVGLSVISAKARRRRIDIDADEFIYHLRAKTPELFRTWLNVLKAHRLYRQHLLTFGARESVPKVHTPLEDLPAADNSAHATISSAHSTVTSIENFSPDNSSPILKSPLEIEPSVYTYKDHSAIFAWQQDALSVASLVPLNFEDLEQNVSQRLDENMFDLKLDAPLCINNSMCSMKCFEKKRDTTSVKKKKSSPDIRVTSTDAEKQMTCTDLDLNQNSLKSSKEQSTALEPNNQMLSHRNNSPTDTNNNIKKVIIKSKENNNYTNQTLNRQRSPFIHSNHKKDATACFFFTRKKNTQHIANSAMKKSRKCTDLVKYKNVSEEPPLKYLTSKCMLLGKYKLVVNELDAKPKTSAGPAYVDEGNRKAVACNVDIVHKENNEVQVMTAQEHKGSQKVSTPADYDKIAENLIVNIFDRCSKSRKQDVKFYIEQVIKDLYDVKVNQEVHPVKALFRNLLEYWLKNTSVAQFKKAMTNEKSVDQSRSHITKDEKLSSFVIKMKSKETQINGFHEVRVPYKCNANTATVNNSPIVTRQKIKEIRYENKYQSPLPRSHSPKRDTASFEKERRIQELEKLLKSTVYMCELGGKSDTKDKDIKITKQLIEHIGVRSKDKMLKLDSGDKPIMANSGSSAELPEIQDTINNLLSETAIPPDIAKELLGAYLDVLMQDSSKSTSTSHSSDWGQSKEIANCEVVGEAIIKKVSKSVTTISALANEQENNAPNTNTTTDRAKLVDPGQIYLKDILDKVTTIFSKVTNMEDNTLLRNKPKEETIPVKDDLQKTIKDELGRPVIKSKYDLIYENYDQNSLVIDLSKYNLEHISMLNDPNIKDIMSITIKLKEKPPNLGEEKSTRLSFKFPDDAKPISVASADKRDNWLPFLIGQKTSSSNIFQNTNKVTCNFESIEQKVDPIYFSNISDGTSKGCCFRDDSGNSSDVPIATQPYFTKDTLTDKKDADELQPCYLMSIKKGTLASKFQTINNIIINKSEVADWTTFSNQSPNTSTPVNKGEDLSIFEKPAPKIIDEKFILLLLENLSFVSRNVVSMHKDISTLYMKLKKKNEKSSRNFPNKQGLSLLGKIYSEDTCNKDGDDNGTQCDLYVQDPYKAQKTSQAATNTNINRIGESSACTYTDTPMLTNAVAQTDKLPYILSLKASSSSREFSFDSKSSRHNVNETETNTADIKIAERSTSNPNWFRVSTAEAAVNTIVRYDLRDAMRNPLKTPRPNGLEKQAQMKNFSRVQEALIKEISLLPSAIKVSTQSQTDKQLLRFLQNNQKRERNDTYIYQLFKSRKSAVTSSSLTLDVELSDDMRTLYRCSSYPSICSGLLSPTTPTIRGPQAGFVSGTPGGRFAGWIIESGGPLDVAARELGQAQLSVQQLQRLLDALELQHQHHDTDVSLEGASPNVKKDRRKFGLRKKKSSSKCASVELAPPHIDLSSSHTALSSLSALTAPPSPGAGAGSASNSAASLPIACAAARPQSLPGADTLHAAQGPASITSLTPDHQLREDFTVLAKDLVASLKGVVSSLICERGRLRAALDAAEAAATPGGAVMAALRTNLTSALQQNSELRTRLSRIHDASDIAEVMSVANSETARQFQQSLSYSSSCVSASEFFDAEEHEDDDQQAGDVIPTDEAGVIELDGDSSSEAGSLTSEEGSANSDNSDNSDGAMLSAEQVTLRHSAEGGRAARWARRTRLPAPRPTQGGPSLWNLLYKNIGKDLSQISMPVTINEPLNMLQRLCEELEYSELLDSAAACSSAMERAALVAAFAVSAYASSAHRAASKPFNPLLAETYECVRDDRSFRFLAEQVSHHPPISACHAESPRWCFWQEARIKTKFWGKSMEFQPTGRVHVRLNTTGDHYTWNKVTTCVHNLFGGQRWVDQYGDMHIVCVGTDISCKLNFIKASSWSQARHEVRGAVAQAGSGARLRLAGRWSEALYAGEPPAARCLWRPGAMPPEYDLYYGFTRFAMELNELEPGMREMLPHTDTRLRPDQRSLEEGDVESAERYKLALEQAQRERRRESATHQAAWFRKTVDDAGEETWVFSGEYWKAREAGFSEGAPRIW